MADTDTWLIGVTVGSGVVFEGNREQAQDHMNAYVAYLKEIFDDKGLTFIRKEHTIRLKGSNVDESDDVDVSQNGAGLLSE